MKKNEESFPTKFRYKNDVRFCAILLRLADILDFDRSRSPAQVYRDLGLSDRRDERGKTSDLEWRKHLSSEGFVFPEERGSNYQLGFLAGPDSPAVEHDVREFLNLIENELTKCTSVLRSCSDRWKKHVLPGDIDRQNIQSQGYTYGEHRFTLDQREVLQLLMGDKLYENPYVFVRELLQNAIDTSRHREFHERSIGNTDFTCEPIQVSEWVDREGYQWVRIEDFGMGMTEQIINTFLLQIGRSYYTSAQFEADVIRYTKKDGQEFKPISRFGIGLLSCFIVGDRVEVATRHATEDDGPIRLSLSGVQDFFVLQRRPNSFKAMPAPAGEELGERKSLGTTICVRLDPRREGGSLVLSDELRRHLLCPPVPVVFEDEEVGGAPEVLLDKPWCQPVTIQLSEADTAAIGSVLGAKLTQPLEFFLLPVDITAHSPTSSLKGQMFSVGLVESDELKAALETRKAGQEYMIKEKKEININIKKIGDEYPVCINIEAWFVPKHKMGDVSIRERRKTCTFNLLPNLSISKSIPDILRHINLIDLSEIALLGHNGMALPVQKEKLASAGLPNITTQILSNQIEEEVGGKSWGLIMLQDDLRPDMSVSRDRLTSFPHKSISESTLAMRRALKAAGAREKDFLPHLLIQGLDYARRQPLILLGDLLNDELLTRDDMWVQEKVFLHEQGLFSVADLVEDPTVSVELKSVDWFSMKFRRFDGLLEAFLARYWLKPAVRYKDSYSIVAHGGNGRARPISDAEKLFPPLFFIEYEAVQDSILRANGISLYRIDHPFSQWLLEHAVALHDDCSGLFSQVLYSLLAPSGKSIDPGTIIQEINKALRRIGDLKPDMKPPKQAFLTSEDFGYKG